ncbi:enoyl-CoA hydratase-related protein [Kibdelosporangium phytohabitans]|uniref:Enoyl-CoA hydratase n=1 Tax=Kibdelosporangium phytohabitans TaxID=860235 RepID=A0A0N9IDL9_9PSEU|nr:enoyl-CoA hydratase-related protein [Kibdelosporangium phytohabitans]ALG13158.1 enoyl-CoA hydratase [Kibdelosporangium phytohabitans]MBE1464910.1 enoyl-CoA hydratase/carnithine racemase [Kibdelosporangium phytohabitans]
MTLEDGVRYSVTGGVATVTFDRPDRNNSMDLAMERRYGELLRSLETDTGVRAIVLTGAGRAFCPGADLDVLAGVSPGNEVDFQVEHVQAAAFAGKPVIAAVNGGCAGLGFVIACTADVRFAAAGAKFTTAFARRGLIAEYGIAQLLPGLVGRGRAMDLLLSGRTFTAEQAHSYGLVQEVFPGDELLAAAEAYARELAAFSAPRSMAVMKRQVLDEASIPLEEAGLRAAALMNDSFTHPESKEGVVSWLERRPPQFPPYPA